MSLVFKIHEADNVAVALKDLTLGTSIEVSGKPITLVSDVSQANKIALCELSAGDIITKYGCTIGHATTHIAVGERIDHHNLRTGLNELEQYEYQPNVPYIDKQLANRDIKIYRRSNGKVGIRNELWIIPTVGCVNAIAQMMKNQYCADHDTSDIDGVHVFTHQFGCSQLGSDHENTKRLLQLLATHPNAGGVLVVGLGCENNQIKAFKESLGEYDPQRIQFLDSQDHQNEVDVGLDLMQQLHERMKTDHRVTGQLHEISFGLECGGSDGFSGITANPLLGRFSDYVISNNGTTVLTEVPEMFGAERILMSRCNDKATFDKTVAMVNKFKQYFIDHNQPIYENPSPGNKIGGISTLEEKSLGCIQKAGNSLVKDVLDYGDVLNVSGLNLLSAPGNDAIATSALAISGCQMVLFSTGRGTPYGGPVPTLKLSTNSSLAQRKPHWIDFNAGALVENISMSELLVQFVDKVVAIINGELTCNEKNNFREIAVYKSGVTL